MGKEVKGKEGRGSDGKGREGKKREGKGGYTAELSAGERNREGAKGVAKLKET